MNITRQRVSGILTKASGVSIAVLGDLMLDTYITGSASRLSQEAPVPILHVRKKSIRLGGAANVMRNLTALAPDCTVHAFGIAGNDSPGHQLRELLQQGNVKTDGVLTDFDRPTTEKQRVLAGNQQVVRMDFEEVGPVAPQILKELEQQILKLIETRSIQGLILEDYAKGLLDKNMLQTLVDAACRNQVFTSLDPHPCHPMEVRHISLMTPNRSEAFSLAGLYCTEPADRVEDDAPLRKVAKRILETWEPETLLITLGHQGMALFHKNNPDNMLVIPTVAREVFDVSGAGDTVIATYSLASVCGASPEEAALISNQAAGIVVGKAGTATTSAEELLREFR